MSTLQSNVRVINSNREPTVETLPVGNLAFGKVGNNYTIYGNSDNTIQLLNSGGGATISSLPIGGIIAFAGSAVPDGYFLCDGSEKSRVEYALLFAAIGTKYGNGDGSSTFNLPDYRNKTLVGAGSTLSLGVSDGSFTNNYNSSGTAITKAQLPNISLRVNSDGNTTGTVRGVGAATGGTANNYGVASLTTVYNSDSLYTETLGSGQTHTHTVSDVSTLQPSIGTNYIIKYDTVSGAIPKANNFEAGIVQSSSNGDLIFVDGDPTVKHSIKADLLSTPRTINGVSFDGSKNITITDSTKIPLTGSTAIAGNLIPSANNKYDLGMNPILGNRWRTMAAQYIETDSVSTNYLKVSSMSGEVLAGPDGGEVEDIMSNSSIIPIDNNVRNLGSGSQKWNSVYATNFVGNASSASTLSSTLPINKGGTGNTTGTAAYLGNTNYTSSTVVRKNVNVYAGYTTATLVTSVISTGNLMWWQDDAGTVFFTFNLQITNGDTTFRQAHTNRMPVPRATMQLGVAVNNGSAIGNAYIDNNGYLWVRCSVAGAYIACTASYPAISS